MICPSCKKSGPVSFRCRNCGAELMRGRYRGDSSRSTRSGSAPAFHPPVPGVAVAVAGGAAGAGTTVVENPYASPRTLVSSPESSRVASDVLASRGSRLAAALTDGIAAFILMIPGLGGLVFLGPHSSNPTVGWLGVAIAVVAFIGFCIYQIGLLVREGQTLGKKLMHIRIVNYDDGLIPSAVKLLVMRYIVNSFLGNIIPFYAVVDVLLIFGNERRCIHDYLAGTKVVET